MIKIETFKRGAKEKEKGSWKFSYLAEPKYDKKKGEKLLKKPMERERERERKKERKGCLCRLRFQVIKVKVKEGVKVGFCCLVP